MFLKLVNIIILVSIMIKDCTREKHRNDKKPPTVLTKLTCLFLKCKLLLFLYNYCKFIVIYPCVNSVKRKALKVIQIVI